MTLRSLEIAAKRLFESMMIAGLASNLSGDACGHCRLAGQGTPKHRKQDDQLASYTLF